MRERERERERVLAPDVLEFLGAAISLPLSAGWTDTLTMAMLPPMRLIERTIRQPPVSWGPCDKASPAFEKSVSPPWPKSRLLNSSFAHSQNTWRSGSGRSCHAEGPVASGTWHLQALQPRFAKRPETTGQRFGQHSAAEQSLLPRL